jgi:hypothetical protein
LRAANSVCGALSIRHYGFRDTNLFKPNFIMTSDSSGRAVSLRSHREASRIIEPGQRTDTSIVCYGHLTNLLALDGIMSEKTSITLPGTVEKILKFPIPDEPEKAQIAVEGADELYREIRIDNTLRNEDGEEVSLKPGARVEVTLEAETEATTPKSNDASPTALVP